MFSYIPEINFSYHAKQIAKGLAMLGLGAATYFGLSALFGGSSKSEESNSKIEEVDTDGLAPIAEKNQFAPALHTEATNAPPVLVNNSLTLMFDEDIVPITSANLAATDEDDDPESLLFTVSNAQGGQFEFTNGTKADQFTQKQVRNGEINFHADYNFGYASSLQAIHPSYQISVRDIYNITPSNQANVTVAYLSPVMSGISHCVKSNATNTLFHLSNDNILVQHMPNNGQDHLQIYFPNGTVYGDNLYLNSSIYQVYGIYPQHDRFLLTRIKNYNHADENVAAYSNNLYELHPEVKVGGRIIGNLANNNFVVSDCWLTVPPQNNCSVQLWDANFFPIGTKVVYQNGFNAQNAYDLLGDKYIVTFYKSSGTAWEYFSQIVNYNGTLDGGSIFNNVSLRAMVPITNDKFIASVVNKREDGINNYFTLGIYYYNGTQSSQIRILTSALAEKDCGFSLMPFPFSMGKKIAIYTGSGCPQGPQFTTLGHIYNTDTTRFDSRFIIENAVLWQIQYNNNSLIQINGNCWQEFSSSNFTLREFPKIINNTLAINRGESIILSNNELSATILGKRIDNLVFKISDVENGWFEYVENGTSINQFSQQEIVRGLVQFTHDIRTSFPPAYKTFVQDSNDTFGSPAKPATIYFGPHTSAPTSTSPTSDNTSTIVGVVVGITSGLALLSTAGILFWRYKNRQKQHDNSALASPLLDYSNMEDISENNGLQEIAKTTLNFTDKDELGRGSFATVYKGTWQGSTVAIKKLNQIMLALNSTLAITEFKSEAGIMNRLRHPNVVQLFGLCQENKEIHIVMEFMPGGSLFAFLRKDGSKSWQVRIAIINDITNGLAYMHSLQILHRDLKSLNILLTSDNRAKLADFGLAKVTNPQTVTKTNVGSPAWAAPEVLNSRPYTEKADVYSHGIILWEIGTRQELYANCDHFQVINQVKKGNRPPLPDSKVCPKSYVSLMQKCWDQRSENRPSMSEVQKKMPKIETACLTLK